MKITNHLGLPDALVRAVESDYQYKPKRYSITSLLEPERALQLKRRYNDRIEQDVADCIWMILGTAAHKVLEEINVKDGEHVERKLEHTFDNGYTLSGIVDNIYKHVDDYKTTSVWSVLYKSNDEKWKKQLQMGAYLHYKNGGEWISQGRIIAILKDWNKKELLKNDKYPKHPVEVIHFDLGKSEDIEAWLIKKFDRIAELEQMFDTQLPMCSLEERFNRGDKYAVIKKGVKRATKVHDTIEEAQRHLTNLNEIYPDKYTVELRKGDDVKCKNYCACCEFCPYYQDNYLMKELEPEYGQHLERQNKIIEGEKNGN